MSDHEQRVRDACLAWDGTSLDDRDLPKCVRVGDLRALLADLATARAEVERRFGIGGELIGARRERDEAWNRIESLSRDLARVTEERDNALAARQRAFDASCDSSAEQIQAERDLDAARAKLARCEGLLRSGMGGREWKAQRAAYFAESEQARTPASVVMYIEKWPSEDKIVPIGGREQEPRT